MAAGSSRSRARPRAAARSRPSPRRAAARHRGAATRRRPRATLGRGAQGLGDELGEPAPWAAHAGSACAASSARFSSAASASVNSLEVAVEDLVEVVGGQLHPVVGDPALREVVGADLLRALAGADLRLALGRDLGLLLGQLALIEPGAQHPHRLLPVLKLRLLVLHRDHDARRLVGDAAPPSRWCSLTGRPARTSGRRPPGGRSDRSRPRPPRPPAAPRRSRSRCGCAPATRSSARAGPGACRPRT